MQAQTRPPVTDPCVPCWLVEAIIPRLPPTRPRADYCWPEALCCCAIPICRHTRAVHVSAREAGCVTYYWVTCLPGQCAGHACRYCQPFGHHAWHCQQLTKPVEVSGRSGVNHLRMHKCCSWDNIAQKSSINSTSVELMLAIHPGYAQCKGDVLHDCEHAD